MQLTGHQRYRQVCLKSDIIARREMRAFMAGELAILPCSGDRERDFIIRELDRAYEIGRCAAQQERAA